MRLYHSILAATIALISLCGGNNSCECANHPINNPDIFKPGEMVATCSLQTQRTPYNSGIFELECWFTDGYRATTSCDFSQADETAIVEDNPMIFLAQFADYRGSYALEKARTDFNKCPQLKGIAISGSRHKEGKLSFVNSAVSPWTLDQITEEELQKVANKFNRQKVAAYQSLMGLE